MFPLLGRGQNPLPRPHPHKTQSDSLGVSQDKPHNSHNGSNKPSCSTLPIFKKQLDGFLKIGDMTKLFWASFLLWATFRGGLLSWVISIRRCIGGNWTGSDIRNKLQVLTFVDFLYESHFQPSCSTRWHYSQCKGLWNHHRAFSY